MTKLPFVKPLSKAAVGKRISGILGIFQALSFALASAFVSIISNAKDGLTNQNNKGRE
jgi:hypothetical protein